MGGYFCRQIYLLSVNLPGDLETVRKSSGRNGGFSAGRFTNIQLISKHIWSRKEGNLLATIEGVFLTADLLTVS